VRKQIRVVGAVIVRDSHVLCAQRGTGTALAGFWEFPGGKIEQGELARAALEREIAEELGCIVEIGKELTTTTYAYDFGDVTLTTFWCQLLRGEPALTEHAEVRWVAPDELDALHWAPADVPAVNLIMSTGLPNHLWRE
jgi:8-oxo-dGTP diphosphatase